MNASQQTQYQPLPKQADWLRIFESSVSSCVSTSRRIVGGLKLCRVKHCNCLAASLTASRRPLLAEACGRKPNWQTLCMTCSWRIGDSPTRCLSKWLFYNTLRQLPVPAAPQARPLLLHRRESRQMPQVWRCALPLTVTCRLQVSAKNNFTISIKTNARTSRRF